MRYEEGGMGTIEFDFAAIPECVAKDLGKTFYEMVTEFYKDPANVKAYEEWKAKREERR